MVIRPSTNKQEQERIEQIFESGRLLRREALRALIQAIIMVLMVVVHIATFAINLAIGILTTAYGLICAVKLLLEVCQDLAMMPVVPKENMQGGIRL